MLKLFIFYMIGSAVGFILGRKMPQRVYVYFEGKTIRLKNVGASKEVLIKIKKSIIEKLDRELEEQINKK